MNPAILSRIFAAKQEPEPQWGPNPYAQANYGVPPEQQPQDDYGERDQGRTYSRTEQDEPLTLEQEPSDLWGVGQQPQDDGLLIDGEDQLPGIMQQYGDAPMPPTGTQMLDRVEQGPRGPLGVMFDPETEASQNMPMSRLPPGLAPGGNIYPGDVGPPIRGGRMTSR